MENFNTAHVDSMDSYPFDAANKANKFMKEQFFVTKNMKHLLVFNIKICIRTHNSMCLPVHL